MDSMPCLFPKHYFSLNATFLPKTLLFLQNHEHSIVKIKSRQITVQKFWKVLFHKAFEQEFNELPPLVRQGLVARVNLLKQVGPTLECV
jgi:hypothetical protein